jgi:hypothetical protein
MLFPGTKSAKVFQPKDVTVLLPQTAAGKSTLPAPLPHPNETTRYPTFSPATNATASIKP